MEPEKLHCVIPSCTVVGEPFYCRIRVLGPIRDIPCEAQWDTVKPRLYSPFNLNVQRQIQYRDTCLPDWLGSLRLEGGSAFDGPAVATFDGEEQGVFAEDTRPIGTFGPCSWTRPGIHFLHLVDPVSGVEGWSNPAVVSATEPAQRLFWGDPHWQTFFSDAVRCPEELYAFARDEAFLDFGAITDHVEAITDRQWDYFVSVTNDFNQPGRFVTLVGQEWTKHNPGHRNIYYRGDSGPVLRCTDPRFDSLDKLWQALQGQEALAIPHHTASVRMGVDWDAGWNPAYEKAVEIYSVWGSSERPGSEGNPRPIRHGQGEIGGRHVRDALDRGFRFGFVGGGDIHDGRPGDSLLHRAPGSDTYPSGLTAVLAPRLTREQVYDAMATGRTYATTESRIYLSTRLEHGRGRDTLEVVAASEEGLADLCLMRRNHQPVSLPPAADNSRTMHTSLELDDFEENGDWAYVRVTTAAGNMAWSSPVWADPTHTR